MKDIALVYLKGGIISYSWVVIIFSTLWLTLWSSNDVAFYAGIFFVALMIGPLLIAVRRGVAELFLVLTLIIALSFFTYGTLLLLFKVLQFGGISGSYLVRA